MQGWALVAWVAGVTAAVTALLLWWRRRQFGAALPGLAPGAPRYRRGDPLVLWLWLVSGLVGVSNFGNMATRNPTGREHAFGVVGVVVGAVFVTVAVGGLLLQWRWHRR
jgi:hypothetical protein